MMFLSITAWFSSPLLVCGPGNPSPPNCKNRGYFSREVYWYSSESIDLQEGVTIYSYSNGSQQYSPYNNQTILYKLNTGGIGVPYSQELWEDLSLFGDDWYFIVTDSNGTITTMTQVNTIQDPTC